jgi:hypothetical protein
MWEVVSSEDCAEAHPGVTCCQAGSRFLPTPAGRRRPPPPPSSYCDRGVPSSRLTRASPVRCEMQEWKASSHPWLLGGECEDYSILYTPKMEAVYSSEILVPFCKTTHRHFLQKTAIFIEPRYFTNRLLMNLYPSLCFIFICCIHTDPLSEPNHITDIKVLEQQIHLPCNS